MKVRKYKEVSHSVYDLTYHLVWVTKHRKRVLGGLVGERLRELIRETCDRLDVEIISGQVSEEHVYMLVSIPPYLSVSKLMKSLKKRSSRKMRREFKVLKSLFGRQNLWEQGYFAGATGSVTKEVVEAYIENRARDCDQDDWFQIGE